MLKPIGGIYNRAITHNQPPSGGCVLKLLKSQVFLMLKPPAAFGRLCVETLDLSDKSSYNAQPPSGGCVLKLLINRSNIMSIEPAAFGRLCVETCLNHGEWLKIDQPPSGGCVLKHAT